MNKILILALVFSAALGSCGAPPETAETVENVTKVEEIAEEVPIQKSEVEILLESMTLERKVGQMFFCAFRNTTEMSGDIIDIINYGVGGVVFFTENIQSAEQTANYINALQSAADIPLFIAIDEEGGRVRRTQALDVPRIPPALEIENAYEAAETIAGYLAPLGFNVNFAPVADVFTNPSNTVIGDRAFSKDPDEAAQLVASFTKGLLDSGILPALKHFPGHGDTAADTHSGAASTNKTLGQLRECEFIPFRAGINSGAPFVMTGHITAPEITGGDLPATFSEALLGGALRGELGFEGVIITDALDMGAVTFYYTPGETAVNAVLAGVDMLLMPQDFAGAYNALLDAVKTGRITEERIDESVKRILTVKYKLIRE